MNLWRKISQSETRPAAASLPHYLHLESLLKADADKHAAASDQLSSWLPTMRTYLLWSYCTSVAWEITCLPLSSIWVSGQPSEIALFAIQVINSDLIIALGTLVATLFIFGSSQWPARGYRSVAALTIIFGFFIAALNHWMSVDVQDIPVARDGAVPDTIFYAAAASHLKWIVVPTLAFWQASHVAQHR